MQGYNNYNNYNAYGNQNGMGVVNPRLNYPNAWNGYNQIPQQPADSKTYVNGRAGADAYPIPHGMNEITLWDTESHRFFVKGYDNNGMPRVLEDNDYTPHVEPETSAKLDVDLSAYATKDDIRTMISDAFSGFRMPNMNGYMTKQEFDQILSELSVGNGGRIVRINEPNR